MKFDKLLEIREENGLRQKDVAKILNMSTGNYAMNEEGYDTITLKNLILLFNLSILFIKYLTINKIINK